VIDLVYYEVTAPPQKDYIANHLHHIAVVIFVILVLHYEVLWSISIASIISGMVMEAGSALLVLKDILSDMYKPNQLPMFSSIHNYGFDLLDLLAFVILACAVWTDFRTNGIPVSPLYWLLIVFFTVLLITREILFEPLALESKI